MNKTYYTMEPQQSFQGSNYNLWQPTAYINNKIHTDAGIKTNWKYRQYIQKNANEIMKYNTMQSINASGNNPYTLLNNTPTNNVPQLFTSIYDTNNFTTNSDLKADYMKKEQMKGRMIAPSISTNF